MCPQITKEHALKIKTKLKGKIVEGRSGHSRVIIKFRGKKIAHYGLRRGSKKNLGHDFIPEALHITPNQTKKLANCPLSEADWLIIMWEKGYLLENPAQ